MNFVYLLRWHEPEKLPDTAVSEDEAGAVRLEGQGYVRVPYAEYLRVRRAYAALMRNHINCELQQREAHG